MTRAPQQGDTTIVLTSYRRPDLLAQTLGSLAAADLTGVAEMIVIEDSDDAAVVEVVDAAKLPVPVRVLRNLTNLGQIASIDRAYARVKTPYIYHCEEDWLFPSGLFLDESRLILESDPMIHAVMVRDPATYNAHFFTRGEQELNGIRYWVTIGRAHRKYGALSFNPGLRRLSDYRRYAPYAQFGLEQDLSFQHKMDGYRLAVLKDGDVTHIGADASTVVEAEKARQKERGFLLKSLMRRLRFAAFRLSSRSRL